jgi:small subunit ribosomal protein S1
MAEEKKQAAENKEAAKTEAAKESASKTPETEADSKAEEKSTEKTEPKAETKTKAKKAEKVDVDVEKEKSEPEDKGGNAKASGSDCEPVDYDKVEPLEDFDWSKLGKQKEVYSEDEVSEMDEEYSKTLTSIAEHEVVEGTIVSLGKKEAVINIGYKSEGIVQTSEFRYDPDIKVGDKVDVYVESLEDKEGQLVLSHKKARTLSAWEKVNKAKENDEIIKGYVKCRTKGGLIADVFGLEAFLPGSQIDVKPIRDYDQFVNKTMEFKVVKINHEFKNVVVSHKALIEAELEQQKAEIMTKLEKGQVLEGTVKNITSYGVFIDLGGVDGLIHITDLSWGRINHPEEVVELDQKLNVVILDFDDSKKRIALGLKQLQSHPWDQLDENLNVGDKVKGKVVVLADYGAFVEIQPGVEGLIHVSEMSWSQHLRTAQDFFKVGDEVEAVIMTLDREERKMSLSTRRLTPDPWENIEEKYPVESKHKGKVTNLSNFGVFVELEEGIDGLVHISDLSWSKKVNHPTEFCKVGDELEVVVLEIDKDNRRLSLGHKQLEENPWDVFETVFTEGSVHQGTVISKNDKGFIVSLPYGVEGFCPTRHANKGDGGKINIDDTLDFEILEFNKEAKKIIISHGKLHDDVDESKGSGGGAKKKSPGAKKATRKQIKSHNDKGEKTTLGDLDALSDLKQKMENGDDEK